jgi:hypothetical protein
MVSGWKFFHPDFVFLGKKLAYARIKIEKRA